MTALCVAAPMPAVVQFSAARVVHFSAGVDIPDNQGYRTGGHCITVSERNPFVNDTVAPQCRGVVVLRSLRGPVPTGYESQPNARGGLGALVHDDSDLRARAC